MIRPKFDVMTVNQKSNDLIKKIEFLYYMIPKHGQSQGQHIQSFVLLTDGEKKLELVNSRHKWK